MIYQQSFTRNFFQNNVDNLKLISNNSLAIKIDTKIKKICYKTCFLCKFFIRYHRCGPWVFSNIFLVKPVTCNCQQYADSDNNECSQNNG